MSETEPPPPGTQPPEAQPPEVQSPEAQSTESEATESALADDEVGLELPWDPDTGPLPDADSGPEPARSGPRSHRAQLAAGQQLQRLLAPVSAVAVVIIVILLLIWINGRPPDATSSASVAGGSSGTHAAPPVVTPKTSPAVPSSGASASASHPPTATTTSAPPARPVHSKRPIATAMATVQVLNNSRRTGLAHAVASELAAKGWHLGLIGNLQGLVAEPTVYYSPGEKAAAQHLAREFDSIKRIEPNRAQGLTATGITLVLTAAWDS